MSFEPPGDRPGSHSVLWGTLGALVGAALGFVFAGLVAIPVLDALFPNEGGLETLGPTLLAAFATLIGSVAGGAIAGARLLLRWHRGRA